MTVEADFQALTCNAPFAWQRRLYAEHFASGAIPGAVDVPTGLGKTSVMALWLIARARCAHLPREHHLPRRLVYVVDRRAVVDQATDEAEKLRDALEGDEKHFDKIEESKRAQAKQIAAELKAQLGLAERTLPISTLRGAHVDNRDWLEDPAAPAIVVGTVDMIGSRLLFEGYGVSRKMRPYHAGFLGVDTLVVLDEAHLVPPFAHLLRAIETDPALWPKDDTHRALLPPFKLLPLSATRRDVGSTNAGSADAGAKRAPFTLESRDVDEVTSKRLDAHKHLRLRKLASKDADAELAQEAWELATKDGARRVVVFCDKRDKNKEGGAGPTAQGVADAIEDLAKGDKKKGRAKIDIHPVELLVGARRVRERKDAADKLRELGFTGDKKPLDKPAFLIATAAGEVGVDIDAEHMVSDLVAWERTVQRLGRVNRRGEGAADVVVFWSAPEVKNDAAPTAPEKRALLGHASKDVIERLPSNGGAFDASPGALRRLAESGDDALKQTIEKATTPEPLRPALNRALVDAWSMTSLETHTGRPEVAPWLRGWVEDDRPQTAIVWRKHLPVRIETIDGRERPVLPHKQEIETFFEAAPPHESEKLETDTYRAVEWLRARAEALLKGARPAEVDGESNETDAPQERGSDDGADEAGAALPKITADDIAAFAFSLRGEYERRYALTALAPKRDSNATKALTSELSGKMLILDARFGGIDEKGMLDLRSAGPARAADDGAWMNAIANKRRPDVLEPVVKFRIETHVDLDSSSWRRRAKFVKKFSEVPDEIECLFFFKWRADASTEDDRSVSRRAQSLADHSAWTEDATGKIADVLGLPEPFARMLRRAAYLHDQGKARELWQRAMGKPKSRSDADWPYAKTDGRRANLALLKVGDETFRHEFASLIEAEKLGALDDVDDELRDLALHLISAHHGFARPNIFAYDPGPIAEGATVEERARDATLRFARLQKRWGPWGLAWWEALLRAADQQASRALEDAPEEAS